MIQSLPPGPTSTLEVTFPHEVWRGHTSKAYQWYIEAMVRVPGQTPNGAHTLMLLAASSDGNERSCVFCFHLFSLSVCSNSSAENQAFKRWPFKGMVARRHGQQKCGAIQPQGRGGGNWGVPEGVRT